MSEEETAAMLQFLNSIMPENGVGHISIKFNRDGDHFNILEVDGQLGRRVVLSPVPWEDA